MSAAATPLIMGRPSKLNSRVAEQVLSALELGATRRHAAAAAGLGERTLYHWLEKGAAETKGIYWQFLQDVKKAEGRCTVNMLQLIQSAAVTDWKAAAWILERSRGYTRTNALQVDVRDVSAEPQTDPRAELLAKLERMREQI